MNHIECVTGVCEHGAHSHNLLTLAVVCITAVVVYVYRVYSTD